MCPSWLRADTVTRAAVSCSLSDVREGDLAPEIWVSQSPTSGALQWQVAGIHCPSGWQYRMSYVYHMTVLTYNHMLQSNNSGIWSQLCIPTYIHLVDVNSLPGLLLVLTMILTKVKKMKIVTRFDTILGWFGNQDHNKIVNKQNTINK